MWAPFSSFFWQGISEQDREAMFAHLTPHSRRFLRLGRFAPLWLIRLFVCNFVVPFSGPLWLQRLQHSLSLADREYLLQPAGKQALLNDNTESLLMGAHGEGMAKDVELFSRPWPFDITDYLHKVNNTGSSLYSNPPSSPPSSPFMVHGTEDVLVPLSLQRWLQQQLPQLVRLYELPGEGHLSWFCHQPQNYHQVLTTLFS
ncbi:hypothetical protein CLOM_g24386 [Closterium sp. NIES-68]|nr:hypothetical protein CLOM_g24386 [Closterium sp. NIES-68]